MILQMNKVWSLKEHHSAARVLRPFTSPRVEDIPALCAARCVFSPSHAFRRKTTTNFEKKLWGQVKQELWARGL